MIDIGYIGDPNDTTVGAMEDEDNIYPEVSNSTYIENGDPVLIDPKGEPLEVNIRLSDLELGAGNGNWQGAVVRIQRHAGGGQLASNPDDLFGFDLAAPLTIGGSQGNIISYSGSEIATFSNKTAS